MFDPIDPFLGNIGPLLNYFFNGCLLVNLERFIPKLVIARIIATGAVGALIGNG